MCAHMSACGEARKELSEVTDQQAPPDPGEQCCIRNVDTVLGVTLATREEVTLT